MSKPQRLTKTRTAGVYNRHPAGTYMAKYTEPGGGRERTRTFKTYGEACEFKRQVEQDKGRNAYRPPSGQTVAKYLTTWLDSYQGRTETGISAATLAEYRHDLETRVIPVIGRRKLTALAPDDIRRLVGRLQRDGLAPRTVRRILAPLKAALADALEDQLIASNPVAGRAGRVPVPRSAPDDRHALTDREVMTLIDNAPEQGRLLIRVAVLTGMRRGELLGLRWGDLDGELGLIHVERRIRDGRVGPPKSGWGERRIPVPTTLMSDLDLARQTSLHKADDHYVFGTRTGKPQSPSNVTNRVLKPAAQAAGLAWVGWHDLRRAAASRWARQGLSPRAMQKLLGHSDPQISLAVYSWLDDSDLPSGDELWTGGVGA